MPSHSTKQAKVMSAISHGWHPSEGSVAKIPVKVAKDFHAADAGHKYGKGMHKGDKIKKALRTSKKYAEGGGTGKSTNFKDFRRSDNMEDRRKEKGDAKFADRPTPPSAYAETTEISPLSWQLGMGAIASGHALDPLPGDDYAQYKTQFAEGGEVNDDKQQTINIHPVDPNEGLFADLNKKSPLEGAAPANPSLTAHQDTPREQITNWLAGPDTPSYAPRSVLANKAMNVLDFTPPMMAEQAGEDVAKGHYQDAAMFMMPGAKKAKGAAKAAMDWGEAMELAAAKPLNTYEGSYSVFKALKEPYPKDLAQQVFYKGYNSDEVNNIATHLLPGAQKSYWKNLDKLGYEPKAPNAPSQQPHIGPENIDPGYHPDFIQNYHTNQGADYDKLLAHIEAAIDKVPSSKPPGPFEVPMETYDKLHDKLSQEYLGLTKDEKNAVSYWGDPAGYKVLQGHLRGTYSSPEGWETISHLNSAMAPLAEPTSVWRGLHGPHAEELKKLGVGDTFWNAGYTATSIDPRRATHYGAKDGPGIILNYHLPEGHPALYTSHPDAGGWSQAEREMLLPHGAPFKILGAEKIKAPVWDYTGNVKNAEPQDFVVYHVAPTDETHGAHQLDMNPGAKFMNAGPKPVTEGFKPKDKDTDIEDYYAHQEKHEAGPEWEPEEGDTSHNVTDIHKNAPFLKMQKGEISPVEYKQAMRNHIKPSNWMDYRPKDVKPEEVPPINWGKNDPEHLQSIGVNTNTHLFKGGMWGSWGTDDKFVPGGYPKEVMDPNKKHSEQSFHMASKPGIAEAYHGGKDIGGSYVAWKPKFAEFDWPSFFGSNHYSDGDLDGITKEAKKMGLDMVAVHNMHDTGSHLHGLHTQYLVLNTNVLRAPHAAFDPQKWYLRHPLAGLAGGGIFTYGALGGDNNANGMKHGGRVEAEKALPANHQLGMKVPKGGSMCANCKFLASPTTCGNKGFIEWNGKPELPAPSNEYCCDLYGHDKPEHKAEGGKVAKKEQQPKDHEFQDFSDGGLIDSAVPGRTDKHPMKVQPGSYVLPADIPSALGQGNTKAGSEILSKMFTHSAYGLKPMTQKAQKFHFDSFPSIGRGKAKGGRTNGEHVPIIAAGGEYIIHPDVVKEVGNGDMAKGHDVLDKFVLHTRKQHIKTLKGLKGPKQ